MSDIGGASASRLSSIESQLAEVRKIMSTLAETQSVLARIEERSISQQEATKRLYIRLESVECRLHKLEKSDDIERGGRSAVQFLGRLVISLAAITASIYVIFGHNT